MTASPETAGRSEEVNVANFKRRRPKNRRAGCLLCKPHKMNGQNEEAFLDSLSSEQARRYFEERSRREMWRWVLSLPFEMLGDRPLWITLTYPGDWKPWVPEGRTLERHRRAFGEAWYRGFGERPVGFWSKEFQLAEGRPHLHLLMKGPDSMSDFDYRGFQILTRLGNDNVRKHGKQKGRWWTPPIGGGYGCSKASLWLSHRAGRGA